MTAKNSTIPIWEWVIAGIGLILVAGAIGTAVYRALTENLTPPMLSFALEGVRPVDNGFLITFKVLNSGSQTASGLTVEGELKSGGEVVETRSVTFGYAPANSEREGGLFFENDPRQYQLMIRAAGYERP